MVLKVFFVSVSHNIIRKPLRISFLFQFILLSFLYNFLFISQKKIYIYKCRSLKYKIISNISKHFHTHLAKTHRFVYETLWILAIKTAFCGFPLKNIKGFRTLIDVNSDTDGKDSIAGEKNGNSRWAHQVKIENSRFSIWTHDNYHNENLKKTRREKSEIHMKISVRFFGTISRWFFPLSLWLEDLT